jgi:general secretion pathway protein G
MRSRGFTLIELLVVIVIIGILMALLVPVVGYALKAGRVAQVHSEIQTIGQALADFQTQHGAYPPSRILIVEDGDYSEANVGSNYAKLVPRSMSALRRVWPRLVLTTSGAKPSISGGFYDVNGDHVKNGPYVMFGHECLAFFLGGIPMQTKDGWALTGFGKNPLNPFTSAAEPTPPQSWPFNLDRKLPFMDFTPGHIKPTVNTTLPANAGSLVAITDALGTDQFYAYFSAYNGSGYDPDDVNFDEEDSGGTTQTVLGGIQSNNDPMGVNKTSRSDIFASPAPNPYYNDSPVPIDSSGALDLTDKRSRNFTAIKTNTFQIISSGFDRKFGIGGQWNSNLDNPVPFFPIANGTATGQKLDADTRTVEYDNVTNFSGGKLKQ